jgi:hypothetical protein
VNLGSLYTGLVGDLRQSFKHLRRTEHTHDLRDDAIANAEAMLTMADSLGLQLAE